MSATSLGLRAAFVCVALGMAATMQGCSSSQNGSADSGSWRLWGSDKTAAAPPPARAPEPEWQQPANFDAPAGPAYRGGRDPVTGRAQQWAPAAPPQTVVVERATLQPLPPAAAPASAPSSQAAYAPPSIASHGAGAPPRGTAAGSTSVEVRQGDTLYRIARAHNVTVPALMQVNSLSNGNIRPGQRLTIPAR